MMHGAGHQDGGVQNAHFGDMLVRLWETRQSGSRPS